jgi:hypothetical protein
MWCLYYVYVCLCVCARGGCRASCVPHMAPKCMSVLCIYLYVSVCVCLYICAQGWWSVCFEVHAHLCNTLGTHKEQISNTVYASNYTRICAHPFQLSLSLSPSLPLPLPLFLSAFNIYVDIYVCMCVCTCVLCVCVCVRARVRVCVWVCVRENITYVHTHLLKNALVEDEIERTGHVMHVHIASPRVTCNTLGAH